MKKSGILLFVLLFALNNVLAQLDTTFVETKINLQTDSGVIYGTLTSPIGLDQAPVALIIAGSGPTDRDGNNPMMKNDALKKLAHELAENEIASVRFDKRGIAESKGAMKNEADLRFEDYVDDVTEWIRLLKEDKRFNQVAIIGHSEGSLIGMLAAANADQYISIAGPGRPADIILKEQLASQTDQVKEMIFPAIDSLKRGQLVEEVNPMVYSLLRPSVQPYLISWFKYNPQQELQKLSIPILIIQGTNDIQVSVKDAEFLADSNPEAGLLLIENMNHIFRIVEGDRETNLGTYNKAALPVSDELVRAISNFINSN